MYNIAVLGAGIIGVSTALNIQKQLPSARVKIISEKFGQETTSWGAGGLFRPTAKFIRGVPEETIRKWSRTGWEFYSSLAVSDKAKEAGMQIVSGYILSQTKVENPVYKDVVYTFHELSRESKLKLGFGHYNYAYMVTTVIATVREYLPWLFERFKENGGQTEQRRIDDLNELVGVYDVVVNCTGFGSRTLFGDTSMFPVRGHLLRVKAPWIKNFVFTEDDAYLIPNGDLLVVGGCRQENNFNLNIESKDREGILERCLKIFPALKGAVIDHEWVGLRPTRFPIRIEKEVLQLKKGPLKVVHNYGHGANGISMSWGTSKDAAELVKEALLGSKL
ncbi:D-aspartate oxidase-like [Saccostrea echinata]|uniref:D-aspartate oxidase-like n=1 Tax=Saccostrea echinata TaxID=191078 RepID=UPI002A80A333|nr:D-aspartate oxidase-like [Saccostrea echinata]